jgi:hypothetical protein
MTILVPESRGSPRTVSRSPSILPGMIEVGDDDRAQV